LVLVAILTIPLIAVSASAPTNDNQLCDPSQPQALDVPLYQYNPPSYVIIPSTACGGISGDWQIFPSRVNFTNIALTSPTNPAQTFGLGAVIGGVNITVTSIASDHIETLITVPSATTIYFYYIMPPAYSSLQVPQTVIYTPNGGSQQLIQQPSYFTLASSFASCSAPCVFSNPSNRTLILKDAAATTYTVDWFFPQNTLGVVSTTTTTSSGGGPPCTSCTGVIQSTTTAGTATTSTTTFSVPNPAASYLSIAVLAVLIVLIVAISLGVRRDEGWRRPSSRGARWRRP
jgi:hypothetical protein